MSGQPNRGLHTINPFRPISCVKTIDRAKEWTRERERGKVCVCVCVCVKDGVREVLECLWMYAEGGKLFFEQICSNQTNPLKHFER
jgi:hypothetical protein